MKREQFFKAIEIIAQNHTSKIIINNADGFVRTNADDLTIDILTCCAAVTNNLVKEGYSLAMHEGKTAVNYYK